MNLLMRVLATARVEAVAPEGGEALLTQFLKLYRDAVQYVVDGIWFLNDVPSEESLHKMFYAELRRLGFRAHHVSEIYKRAREVVEATKKNNGSKPVLKRLTARIHSLDYRIDFSAKVLRVAVLNDEWVELKLKWYSYLNKYLDGSWRPGEMLISYRNNKIFVYITFHKDAKPIAFKTVMGVDINFSNITYTILDLSGSLITIGVIPFKGLRRALHLKKLAEDLQKRYSKSWRFIKSVKKAIDKHGKKIKNISWGYAHKVGDLVAELASKHSSIIALEDLDKLRENNKRGREFNKRLGLWFYRRIQFCIEYEARERSIEATKVNPRKTSLKCPRCGKKLAEYGHRVLRCRKCSFIGDRDAIAAINLYKKYMSKHPRCGVPGVALNAPKPDENPSGVQGKGDDAMKNIKLYEPI
jgi:putative transposase